MKKFLLVTLFILVGFNAFAQSKVNIDNLIGYWEPDSHATQMVFWKNNKNQLQVIEFSTVNGSPLRLLSMKIVNNVLVIKSIYDETNWVTECSYTFINDNTIECIVKGSVDAKIIYTKVK